MTEEVTTKFRVDISDLKRNIADANQQMKLANAQFKASASSMDNWESSADGLSAKIRQMTSVLDAQRSKINAYRSQLELVQSAYEENGRRAEELRSQMAQLIDDGVDPASEQYKEYQRALQDVTREQDANQRAANQLQITILNQEAAFNNTQRELNGYQNALEELEDAQQNASEGAEDQKSAYEELQDTISDQEKALEELKQAYSDAVLQYGKNSDEAKDFESSIKDLSSELATNRQRMEDADDAADDLDASIEEAGDSADDASEGFTVMKGVLANLAAEGIKMAIDGLKSLAEAAFEAYQEFDDGADTVIKATGATGETAQSLAKSYKEVSKSVVGDFNEIGSALGEINTRFGFTDKELEDASVQFMKFAEITGTDATSAVQLVSRAMGDAGIESDKYSEVLDSLALAAQASGISVDTLAGNLTKYGAPMRALGLDTQEAIAIFAGWEKAGVNTEIAFSGMKQAIGKWSKDGKNAREEFKKTLDEIAKCPDVASATTKAIEVFGQKAGPDLADAIQGGRFEYSTFLDLLEDSEGTVTNTYEATQDGFDKINLAIQGARAEVGDYVAQLADKYAPQAEKFAQKVVDVLKKAIKWTTENTKVIGGFASALAGAFVVTKIVQFVKAMADTVTAVKGVATAIKGATAATKLLGIAQAATPWGLVALAIGGVAAAMIAYKKQQDAAIEAEYGLSEAQRENLSAAKESKKAYDEMDSARQQSMQSISAEYGYIDELKDEYNSLIDENGNVKEGYEDRAEVILNTLASALGVERDEIQKNIDANGKLGDSIDALIQKKQAEAILSANQDAYTQAIQNRDEALKTYQASLKTVSDAEKKYQDSVAESGNVLDEYMGLLKTSPNTAQEFYWANQEIIKGQQEAKDAWDEAKEGLKDSESAYLGYINTISNYEGLSAAIISGDADAISSSMLAIQNGLITAENGTKESLEKQLEDAKQTYKDMKQAAADGVAGVSDETVKQAEDMVVRSKQELDKYNNIFVTAFDDIKTLCTNAGVAIPESVASGIQNGEYALPQTVEEMQALIEFDEMKSQASAAGEDIPDYITEGIKDGKMEPSKAVKKMTDLIKYKDMLSDAKKAGVAVPKEITEGVKSGKKSPVEALSQIKALMKKEADKSAAEMNASGKSAGSSYASGVQSTTSAAKSAGESVKSSAKNGATGALTNEGRNAGSTYASGVSSQGGSARNAGSSLHQNAASGSSGSLSPQGQDAGSGYASGVSSKTGSANSAGAALKQYAASGASGSYNALYGEGQNAGRGFSDGIHSVADAAAGAAALLVRNAINAAKAEQNSHSPSRIWRDEIGEMAGEGYIGGLANKIRPAMSEAKTLVKDSIEAASRELTRNPISFDGFGASLRGSLAYATGGISVPSAGLVGSSQGQRVSGDTVITYNQTINSPKAPSRIELYRQTRNLLEYAKGGV